MLIDCDQCALQDTDACQDCVVTFLCRADDASAAVAASCSRRALLFRLPESQATRMPSGSSQALSLR